MKKLFFILLMLPLYVSAAENEYIIVIQNHQFQPREIIVPAAKKIKLLIENKDATPEEFESYSLNREKIIGANSAIKIYLGPLAPGRYPFFGEFNKATAQGVIIAQ